MMASDDQLPGLIALGVREAARNAPKLPAPRLGTVVSIDLDGKNAEVMMDGDTETIGVRLVSGMEAGERIAVDFGPSGAVWARGSLGGPQWHDYDPQWTTGDAVQPSLGNGTLIGQYRRDGASVDVFIYLELGSTSSPGREDQHFTVPFPAANDNDILQAPAQLMATFNISGGSRYLGAAFVLGGNNLDIWMPLTATDNRMGFFRSCDTTGAAGTGIPLQPAAQTLVNGSYVLIQGSYRIV